MFYFISVLRKLPWAKPKVHDFSHPAYQQSYVFEPATESAGPSQFYMTGWKAGVQCGDQILLRHDNQSRLYIVDQIQPYCNQTGLWIALLSPLQSAS
jgi:hypothetical protein